MGLSKQIWKMDISDTDEMKIMEHCISEEHNNILRKQRQQSSHKLDITVHTQFVEQEVPFLPVVCSKQQTIYKSQTSGEECQTYRGEDCNNE